MSLDPAAIARIPRGVRLHFDKVRDRWVLLAPERAISLDPIGHAILTEINGQRDFGTIVDILATRYGAPRDQVAADAGEYIQGLADRRILEVSA